MLSEHQHQTYRTAIRWIGIIIVTLCVCYTLILLQGLNSAAPLSVTLSPDSNSLAPPLPFLKIPPKPQNL